MLGIEDIYNYFVSIDVSKDGTLQKDEINRAKLKPSIFNGIIKENMNYEQFSATATVIIQNSSLYQINDPAKPQDWNWSVLSRVLTKDEADKDIFNIKTKEGEAINADLNFNTPDGEYMLKALSFDTDTFKNTPQENLPPWFEPDKIISLGKQTGHNMDKVHEMGYTGKGITVAVVDTPIIIHNDIKSSLVGYETMENAEKYNLSADFHGQATSDLISGDECGSAPKSKLVYFAKADNETDGLQALRRIIEINSTANADDKIKVVSLSWGFNSDMPGYEEFKQLLKELTDSGVFVVTADFNMLDESIHGAKLSYGSLTKNNPAEDPNDFSNYTARCMFGETDAERTLFFASGDRTVASAIDPSRFRHDSHYSTSWTIPMIAGIYTCALQCAEENGVTLTPAKFWDYALETGQDVFYKDGSLAGKAVDAEALMHYIENHGSQQNTAKTFGL